MYDNISPTEWVLFLCLVIPLFTIGFGIFSWVFMHPDEQAAIMSRLARWFPKSAARPVEQRSDAAERPREPAGTEEGNAVPDLVEQLSQLDDDQLLDILAELRGADGEYRYAESRVAKFIGGRVEDRLAQVRDVRGTERPAPAGRLLRVRDNVGERVIPFR